ncbi:MAG: FAD-binding oxidoreductase [Gammaproteobacteria bacterium]|nr:FAD-binding oxidoreductase [Gammaproteobacteria bacterium]MDH3535208.1 FAD-binding oxidoreductase [Gammaproteobacteria bacterium]
MNTRSVNHLPQDDNTNGWSHILGPRTPKPSLAGAQRARWVVVGAGYAGLAATRRLAENRPDDKVILLDAGEVGENASGRNSGFAIDLPHNVGSSLEELDGSHRYMALARAAIDYHETQIERYGIDCDWTRPGKYHCAVSEQGVHEVLEPFATELDALNEPYTWVDKAQLDGRLGTTHFAAGVYTPGCRLMNPAALVRGLADNMPENVTLYENSPVVSLDLGPEITLTTPRGQVVAEQMILGVNGFADRFGYFEQRLLPMAANASLSRQLTAAERDALGCEENWGVTPANAFASITMRYTSDHRILIRNNIYHNPKMREAESYRAHMKQVHKRLFDERFPMLPDVDMEYTWTGFICLAQNGAPGFGRLADNVYTSVCQNAVGVTKGTAGGMLAADMACGIDNELIGYMESLGTPNRLPPRPFLDIGVRLRFAWDLWKARKEV